MLKQLAILVVLAFSVFTDAEKPLPVNGGQQQEHSEPHPEATKPTVPPLCTSEVCKENAENAERFAYYKAHPEEYLKAAFAPANASNWILAGLGIVGGILAWRTLSTMRQSSMLQLRAIVCVERGIIGNVANPPPGPGERVQTVARIMQPQSGPLAVITIKNTGQTPAYDVLHWGRISIQEYPLKSELPTMPALNKQFRSVLGPSIVAEKTVRLPNALTEAQIKGLRDSTMAIYCHGEIHYRDAFKKVRLTRYRCMYCAITGIEIGTSTDLTLCEDGNEAT